VKPSERLVIDNVHKQLGSVKALNGVSMSVRSGAIHGIIGHNGSGKSTLVKVLSGVLRPDQGTYTVVDSDGGADGEARRPRVATVFQDLGLADNLSVFDNLLVNSFHTNRAGYINLSKERLRATAALATLGLDLPLDLEARKLPEPERVMLCVTRALMHGGVAIADGREPHTEAGEPSIDLLLLDEPTSSLPHEELERFRLLVKGLQQSTGVTSLIVTHNPSDISALCDEFTALKSGEVMCTEPAAGATMSMLAELMAGKSVIVREQGQGAPPPPAQSGRPISERVFVAEGIMTPGLSEPVSMSADEGELVGLTGLEGSGFKEFVGAAMGILDMTSGRVQVSGRPVSGGPAALRRAGAIYIPADRARTSGVPAATVYENMTMGRVDTYCRHGILNAKAERAAVGQMLELLRVDPPDPRRVLSEMSGGQQQKVVVGRALLSGAKLLVFEEPTAAVDVGAREEILQYLQDVSRKGNVVVVASAEFEWMPAVCDRIVVFRTGCIAGELVGEHMSEDRILRMAYGD
jgi:ABC-type sugar transport system ATPase subunit